MHYLLIALHVLIVTALYLNSVVTNVQLKAQAAYTLKQLEAVKRTVGGKVNTAYVCYDKGSKKQLEALLGE